MEAHTVGSPLICSQILSKNTDWACRCHVGHEILMGDVVIYTNGEIEA
jgi:hypothetical protein